MKKRLTNVAVSRPNPRGGGLVRIGMDRETVKKSIASQVHASHPAKTRDHCINLMSRRARKRGLWPSIDSFAGRRLRLGKNQWRSMETWG
jgi:hypothetical protein